LCVANLVKKPCFKSIYFRLKFIEPEVNECSHALSLIIPKTKSAIMTINRIAQPISKGRFSAPTTAW